jgi:hypothetical protein
VKGERPMSADAQAQRPPIPSPDSDVPLIRRLLAGERHRRARRIGKKWDSALSRDLDLILTAEEALAEIEGD